MKYIRTKDGIVKHPHPNADVFTFRYEIVKQADTIEELCDVYVIEHPINAFKFFYDKEEMKKCLFKTCMRLFKVHELKVFGCIKTDKGLIYVAKINDKGELELL